MMKTYQVIMTIMTISVYLYKIQATQELFKKSVQDLDMGLEFEYCVNH